MQSRPTFTDGQAWHVFVERLLDVAATSCNESALTYIYEVGDILGHLDRMSGQEPAPVHERAVERVLAHVRNGALWISKLPGVVLISFLEYAEFCSVALGSILDLCKEDEITLSPSMVVVLAVLVCRQASQLTSPPEAILRVLSTRLSKSLRT